ncbi:hypothetical protein X777_02530 [Ooceraea biroi]|uniref:Uncharacterized protein n=1 Tax=Ooceraea biroi TaxID=2015173 RepID=A0A026WQ90_OOCBI|nr:hypothetical protein X777_02530 [Ooceraea biroi]
MKPQGWTNRSPAPAGDAMLRSQSRRRLCFKHQQFSKGGICKKIQRTVRAVHVTNCVTILIYFKFLVASNSCCARVSVATGSNVLILMLLGIFE